MEVGKRIRKQLISNKFDINLDLDSVDHNILAIISRIVIKGRIADRVMPTILRIRRFLDLCTIAIERKEIVNEKR
jgi:hypothetical protein